MNDVQDDCCDNAYNQCFHPASFEEALDQIHPDDKGYDSSDFAYHGYQADNPGDDYAKHCYPDCVNDTGGLADKPSTYKPEDYCDDDYLQYYLCYANHGVSRLRC